MWWLTLFSIILAMLGAVSAIWFLVEHLYPLRRLSWRFAEKAAERMVKEMNRNGFSPTLIFGIGRGGAIMGSLVSGILGHRPLIVIDRKYMWKAGRRIDDMIIRSKIPASLLDSVLLIAGETHTGNTMRLYYEYFRRMGAKRIAKATLYLQHGSTEPVDYVGLRSTRDLRMPWMRSKNYIRDSRSEAEAKAMQLLGVTSVSSEEDHRVCFLVRHGESVDNASGDRFSGITDSLLTERGISQAADVGKFLTSQYNIDRIYASPMKRAGVTAKEIQGKTGGILFIDKRLREIDYGEWEGLTRQEVFQKWPELYNAWKENPVDNIPPGSENPNDVVARLSSFWDELLCEMDAHSIKTLLIVTHKSTIRLLLTYLTGEPIIGYRTRRVETGSITKILIGKDGETHIVEENCTSHLLDAG
jgi:broad specificity phosphatase PhoE/hypoxanthine phosphoribosyltransferase